MNKILVILIAVLSITLIAIVYLGTKQPENALAPALPTLTDLPTPTPTPTLLLNQPASYKVLQNSYHIFQTFNNCGPAALSMALSYFGINETQQTLGESLRPYQNPIGDNDDKSVTLEELAEKAKQYNLIPFHRPNGNIELIKLFITYDIPVVTRTWLRENEDIGHYRIVKGYDDTTGQLIQDDSLQGKNLWYTYDAFNALWKKFNYEHLVLAPQDKLEIAKTILGEGEGADARIAWTKAVRQAQEMLQENPDDIYSRFNLSVALYNIGEYQQSVDEFEKVESLLPFRTLWYQIEPIEAYYALGNYDRVFAITYRIVNNYNRAFSELYILRGEIYKKQGNLELAKAEFEKAVFYNKNLKPAQKTLSSVNQ